MDIELPKEITLRIKRINGALHLTDDVGDPVVAIFGRTSQKKSVEYRFDDKPPNKFSQLIRRVFHPEINYMVIGGLINDEGQVFGRSSKDLQSIKTPPVTEAIILRKNEKALIHQILAEVDASRPIEGFVLKGKLYDDKKPFPSLG